MSSLLLATALLACSLSSAQENSPSGSQPGLQQEPMLQPGREAASVQPALADSAKLEIEKRVPAKYPEGARAEFLQGRVMVKFYVSETGDVESAEVLSGPILGHKTALEDSALDAAKQWKFKPYIRDGKPVPVATTLPFDFKLEGQIPDWGTPEVQHKSLNPIGQGLMQGRLVHRVQPEYPLKAKLQKIAGVVLLDGIIGSDGNVRFLHVVQGPPILAQAAMDAVQKWRYKPYIFNGEPVSVDTQITVTYTLQ